MNKLKLRLRMKRAKPKFLRQGWFRLKRLGEKWRAPKGKQSKLRQHMKAKGFMPHPGYGSPREVKGTHPCGLKEVLIFNPAQLENIEKTKQCIRISARVGKKKRLEIVKKANDLKLKILNPHKKYKEKIKAKQSEKGGK